jgi:hypothetical protein
MIKILLWNRLDYQSCFYVSRNFENFRIWVYLGEGNLMLMVDPAAFSEATSIMP